MKIRLTAGDHWIAVAIPRIYEGLPARYDGPNPSTRPDPPREFKPPANAPPERLEQLRKRFDDATVELAKIPLNGVRVNVGRNRRTLLVHEGSVAREPGEGLHLRPSRRPAPAHVHAADHDRHRAPRVPAPGHDARGREVHRARASARRRKNSSFDEGLAVGIQALLVSPDFLFRIERDRAAAPRSAPALSDHASTSWRRGCRTSCGRACPTRSCGAQLTAGTLRDPQMLAVPGAAHAPRSEGACARRELRRPVAAVPRARVADARSRASSRSSKTTCACRCVARPSSSSTRSSAKIAASSTSSTAAIRSSTSGWRGTTASRTSPARSSARST